MSCESARIAQLLLMPLDLENNELHGLHTDPPELRRMHR